MNFEPIIKWSGSKRSQCDEIIKHFPLTIDTYHEPFIGGGSMMRCLIDNSSSIHVNNIVCSDLNADLINTWNVIKDNPIELFEHYEKLWNILNKDDNKARKRDYFNEVRSRYNNERNRSLKPDKTWKMISECYQGSLC